MIEKFGRISRISALDAKVIETLRAAIGDLAHTVLSRVPAEGNTPEELRAIDAANALANVARDLHLRD